MPFGWSPSPPWGGAGGGPFFIMQLSIIIVNFNVKYFLHQCLRSVERACANIDAEVLVVDNCSQDGSIEYLQPLHPSVRFIRNSQNMGFAKANNIGIRQTKGKYVLLLNPDTIVSERTLTDCIEFMEVHPEVGGAGVKMLNRNGSFALESRRGIPTPFVSFCKMSGLCSLFPNSRFFGKYYMQYLDKDQENPIEIISGAFMFLRRSALDASGLLDEDFFMYGEDIDLSYRLLKTGQKNYYIPTPILHYKGESTKKNSYRYVQTFYKAMLIFFRKHYKHLGLFYAIPIQSAIYVKGVMTYLNLKLNRSKKDTKGDLDYMKERSFAFCGSEKEYQQLMSAMSRFSIYVNHITVTDKYEWMSLLKTKRFDYIIFNAEDISYADMLEQLQSTSSSPYAPSLATFYPSSRIVITDSYTFEFA